ncbi:MAG: permease prefix domain 1-containing protein, partial [Armatimonadota bacterium]
MSRIEEFLTEVERRYRHEAEPRALTGAIQELRSHLYEVTDELLEQGISRVEAEPEAIRRLGTAFHSDSRLKDRARVWCRVLGWTCPGLTLVVGVLYYCSGLDWQWFKSVGGALEVIAFIVAFGICVTAGTKTGFRGLKSLVVGTVLANAAFLTVVVTLSINVNGMSMP